jgi:hypothetical protein
MRRSIVVAAIAVLVVFAGSCKNQESVNNGVNTNPPQNPLKGQWILEALETIGDTVLAVHPTDTVRAVFGDNASLTGRSRGRCGNYYSGVYEIGPSPGLRIDSIRSSEAVCPISAYWEFIHALESVSRFEISDRLYLYYEGGSKRMWLRQEVLQ